MLEENPQEDPSNVYDRMLYDMVHGPHAWTVFALLQRFAKENDKKLAMDHLCSIILNYILKEGKIRATAAEIDWMTFGLCHLSFEIVKNQQGYWYRFDEVRQ